MNRPAFILHSVIVILLTIVSSLYYWVKGQSTSSQQDTLSKRATLNQPEYTTSRLVTEKPVIDGKLDDECWKKGTRAGDYHQFVPNEGAKPTYPLR